MNVSQRQLFFVIALVFVLCGVERLFVTESFTAHKQANTHTGSGLHRGVLNRAVKAQNDYSDCLGNLVGFEQALFQAATESRIDPKLLLAVMTVESECIISATSTKGAVGLMQILPSTARSVGEFNANQPKDNIRAGAKYLRELNNQFGSDLSLTLAAYNAGPTAVRKYRGVPPYRETKNYVNKVLKVYHGYKL